MVVGDAKPKNACFSRLSKKLAMQVGVGETEALSQMYCLLAITLMS